MNLFKRNEVVAPETITGIDVLRRTVRARDSKGGVLKAVVREIDGLSLSTLEDFAAGKAELSVAILQKLATILYDGCEYDPESGLMRSANRQEPKPAGIPPAPLDRNYAHHYIPQFDPSAPRPNFNPGPPITKPWSSKRPGWA
jgi:hypothetical protein